MKRKLKAAGLTLFAVLAMSAIAAQFAQAASPEWAIEGSAITSNATVSSSGSNFKLTVPARSLTINCTTQTSENGEIIPGKTDKGTIKFSGCSVEGAPTCTVSVAPSKVKTELKLSGTEVYDTFAPESGTTFTTITISGCASAGSFPVTGSTCGKSTHKLTEMFVEQPLVFNEANSTACGVELKFGGTKAVLDGTSVNVLTGTNAGKKFGAI